MQIQVKKNNQKNTLEKNWAGLRLDSPIPIMMSVPQLEGLPLVTECADWGKAWNVVQLG